MYFLDRCQSRQVLSFDQPASWRAQATGGIFHRHLSKPTRKKAYPSRSLLHRPSSGSVARSSMRFGRFAPISVVQLATPKKSAFHLREVEIRGFLLRAMGWKRFPRFLAQSGAKAACEPSLEVIALCGGFPKEVFSSEFRCGKVSRD